MCCFRVLKLSALFLVAVATVNPCTFATEHVVTIESPDNKVALLELFTSEGCSSCPRAEAWLGTLRNESGLWSEFVPVAFHVDYWDHLGWRDRFSSAEFTRRQRGYAASWNSGTIYTPGFVLDGEEWIRAGGLPSPSREKPGKLRLSVENGSLEVSFFSGVKRNEPLVVEVAPLAHGATTIVRRGENAGSGFRTILWPWRSLKQAWICRMMVSTGRDCHFLRPRPHRSRRSPRGCARRTA